MVAPKRLCFKPVPQSGSPKLFSKAAPKSCSQSCCRKLLPKAVFLKLVPKAAVRQGCCSQSCRAKLAAPQSRSPKLLSKAAGNSCSPKLLKLSQSCFLKQLPKAVVLQSNCSSMLLQSRKVAPRSCSPKLLSKVATESHVPKKFPKTACTG